MNRRLVGVGIAALVAHAVTGPALAEQARRPRVGILTPHQEHPGWQAFYRTLVELGYEDGRTISLLLKSADRRIERLKALAEELVADAPDAIVAINTPGALAARDATSRIPIVVADVGDPVGLGLVTSLARSGTNVAGASNMGSALTEKRLSLIREFVPGARRIGLLLHPGDANTLPQRADAERVALLIGVEVAHFEVRNVEDLPGAFEQMKAERIDAALWLSGQAIPFQARSAELAKAHRVPVMVLGRDAVAAGGLISYWIDADESFVRAAHVLDKLLKGADPKELPIEQPTRFLLAINLQAARALGLVVPPTLLVQADDIVE